MAVVPGHSPSTPDGAAQRAPEPPAPGFLQFSGPRYWPTWLFAAWLRLSAALPWRLSVAVHKRFGRVLWWLLRRRRRIVLRNLELCFPELDARAIERLARQHFENVGACFAEIALVWFGRMESVTHRFRVEGLEHVEAALAKGKGVMLYSGHFTPLEICVPAVKALVPLYAFMFTPRRNGLLDALQLRGRRRTGHTWFPNNDVRAMLRLLRQNAVVWYAPDQARSGSGGELLQFFGQPAMTNTATSRLAKVSGAAVVPFFFRRLGDDSGYLLRFHAPLDDMPTADPVRDTMRLTAVLEGFVRECPEQYFWLHRRFKGRPSELPDAYRTRTPPAAAAPSRRAFFAAPLAIALVSLFIVVLDNDMFWNTVLRATLLDTHQIAILASMFMILFCTLTIVLSLALGARLLKLVAVALLLVAAVCGYFMSEYGIVIDVAMIRNIVQTEVREASPLLTGSFFVHFALFGIAPALVIAFVPMPRIGWKRALAQRAGMIALSTVALVGTVYANFAAVSFFGREHDSVRLFMNPGYPVYAYVRYLTRAQDRPPPLRAPLEASIAAGYTARAKRTLFVFLVGETARSDRFSFNGYARDTNRYTRPRGVVNFPHVTSCGTSTADSVPCVFSPLGRAGFTHAAAATHESLFGTLQRLGVEVFWRDNSTGCKDVCDPEHFEQYATRTDADFCDSTGCFDEVLLKDIASLSADTTRDHFIVLHERGSHGPAYHTDVPAWAKEFFPECDLPNLRNCDLEQINNAYDNTILYSDYFLSRVIEFLESRAQDYEVALLYVSDHGESLGENGLYLHGFPYAIAPQEQIRVPMLFWGSPSFYAENGIDETCVRDAAQRPTTHDSIFHTLLPLFGVATPTYARELDLFGTCRRAADGDAQTRAKH